MDVFELSYILRYPLVLLILFIGWNLLRQSIGELRFTFKNHASPSKGFYLTAASVSEDRDRLGGFIPLYHTTYIGSSRSSDIRLKSRVVFKRHAIIYFFDGAWQIRAVSSKTPVYINHFEITHPIPLENMDIIGIGEHSFTFVDERQSAHDANIIYEDYTPDPLYPREKTSPYQLSSLIGMNVFALLCVLLLYLFIPAASDSSRHVLLLSGGICLLVSNLYYFLLPVILRGMDRSILLILYFLSMIGIFLQTRLAILPMEKIDDFPQSMLTQTASLVIGWIMLPFIVFLVSRTLVLENLVKASFVITPLLLVATLIFGNGADSHGATLWISLGGTSLQLTEFAKITYLIVLAGFFKNRAEKKQQVIFAAWAAVVFLLIMLLPDLGSAMILLPTTLIVYVVMTSEYLTTLLILVSGTGLGAIAYTLFPHVQRRIVGWTSLWTEVNDNNRQIVYGLQAMARGGLFGRGLGNGTPAGIPLASSDMVYSIFCEEFGLLAGLMLVVLFIILWLRAASSTIRSRDGFSSSLSLGIGTLLFVEAAIVISGVTGLVPLTGATLPLIAKGGSSVLTIVILFSLLLGLTARQKIGGRNL